MSLWTIKQLAEFVRGQAARGRQRFAFVAKNGDIFHVMEDEGGNGVRVRQENGPFGINLWDYDPFEEDGSSDAWGGDGHDPGDEHMI